MSKSSAQPGSFGETYQAFRLSASNYTESAASLCVAAQGALAVFDLIEPNPAAQALRERLENAIAVFQSAR